MHYRLEKATELWKEICPRLLKAFIELGNKVGSLEF